MIWYTSAAYHLALIRALEEENRAATQPDLATYRNEPGKVTPLPLQGCVAERPKRQGKAA